MTNQRASFEAWLSENYGLSPTWHEDRNCYGEYPAHLAFKAWQAASARASNEDTVETFL